MHVGNWAVGRERKSVVMRSKALPRGANVWQVGSGCWRLLEPPGWEARVHRTRSFPFLSPAPNFQFFSEKVSVLKSTALPCLLFDGKF